MFHGPTRAVDSHSFLWIRILIQLFIFQCGSGSSCFLNAELKQFCTNFLCEELAAVEKGIKRLKRKRSKELVQIDFQNKKNKNYYYQILSFFVVIFQYFPPGSMRIRIHSPGPNKGNPWTNRWR